MWLPAVLFGCTLLTVFATFLLVQTGAWTESGAILIRPGALRASLEFTLATVSILGAHELGHYFLARRHGVSASLPYFIPLPLLGFGTLGAVIRVRDRIPTRNALVDIGAAGPLAGFLVALPFLAWGYAHSVFVATPATAHTLLGPFSLWSVVHHGLPRMEPQIFGDNLLLLAFERVFLGARPAGMDVAAHPFVTAGWLGTLVTMLNLVPVGQLDAGHLTYAVLGDRARLLGRLALVGLAVLTLTVSFTWLAWLLVVWLVVGVRHPPLVRPEEPLGPLRGWVCAATAVVAVLCFLPAPFVAVL
ncbi:MAG TPA: site-2 protease family protein [Myxococcaceae bacterium]|nr:site-2 protease family protein [Myxococcaceae bacterium]